MERETVLLNKSGNRRGMHLRPPTRKRYEEPGQILLVRVQATYFTAAAVFVDERPVRYAPILRRFAQCTYLPEFCRQINKRGWKYEKIKVEAIPSGDPDLARANDGRYKQVLWKKIRKS